MFYISLIIIFTGLFLVIVSFMGNSEKTSASVKTNNVKESNSVNISNTEMSYSSDENYTDLGDPAVKLQKVAQSSTETLVDEYAGPVFDIKSVKSTEVPSENNQTLLFSAVLYEDQSGLIDYDFNQKNIKPDHPGFKSFKRIGSGEFELVNLGYNFSFQNQFYRIDFQRIERIYSGENYIAVKLDSGNTVRLFLFLEKYSQLFQVKAAYDKYLSSKK